MNPGGEPERDDTGLPPVDIEIPDDARELDRDVQAYYRELRAQRRRDRHGRWRRLLGRDGIVLPLLACCLILALITGTLLTVFTATSDQSPSGLPGTRSTPTGSHPTGGATTSPSRPASGSTQPGSSSTDSALPHTSVVRRLPTAVIAVDGQRPQEVSTLRKAMLVLVPRACNCGSTLDWLAGAAFAAHARAYVIYSPATKAEVEHLYGQLDTGLRAGTVVLAQETDGEGVLTSPATVPAGISAGQLTAIMVNPAGTATWASGLSPAQSQAPLVQAITGSAA